MLYCPKCNQTYEEGVQRFCTNDEVRLLSAISSDGQPKNVFTKILNRLPADKERSKTFTDLPKLVNSEENPSKVFETQMSAADEIQATRADAISESQARVAGDLIFEPEAQISDPQISSKTTGKLIKHYEVSVSQASLGDRAVNPSGREPLSWENPEILIGQTIKGRYKVVGKLGEDETGIVYLAEDKIKNAKKVVARILMEEEADDSPSRILAEERVSLAHVNHPNVAHLFDSGELLEGIPFIVTEYVAGESLKEKIAARAQSDVQQTARIVQQTAGALGEAHRSGVLHRNLKPKNIILGVNDSGTEQVKVTDFGVFDGFEEQSVENLAYLSPEQLDGKPPTSASDIYSLAVIAFQLLTGRSPFDYSTRKELLKAQKEGLSLPPTDLRLDAPPAVNEVLIKALAFDPARRYPKARDFGDAFYNALTTAAPPEIRANQSEKNKSGADINVIPEPGNKISAVENIAAINEPEILTADKKPIAAEAENQFKNTAAADDSAWETRAPKPVGINIWRVGLIVLGILILGASLWGIWNYFLNS